MLVLDVSGSMLTKDFTIGGQEATRVDAIREVTRKFIEGRPKIVGTIEGGIGIEIEP